MSSRRGKHKKKQKKPRTTQATSKKGSKGQKDAVVTDGTKKPSFVFGPHLSNLYVAIGVFVTLVTFIGILLAWHNWGKRQRHLDMSLAFFQQDGNSITLVDPRDIKLAPSLEDMQSGILRIPLNLAVHNEDNDPLEVVKIVIQYPHELKVRSSARRGISVRENSIVYEHEIGTLDQVAHYTPLQDIDVLELPYQYLPVHVATLTNDGVPMYMVPLATYPPNAGFVDTSIMLKVSIYCKNRKPVTGSITFTVRPNIQLIDQYWDKGDTTQLRSNDSQLVTMIQKLPEDVSCILDHWKATEQFHNKEFGYWKVKTDKIIAQVITVSGQTRRIIVDMNSDGKLEFEYWDTNRDGIMDTKYIPPEPQMTIDWLKEAVEK